MAGIKLSRKVMKGQANKGTRRLPGHRKTTKDAVSCEKPWVVANRRQTTDLRMGQPIASHIAISQDESIVLRGQTRGTETS